RRFIVAGAPPFEIEPRGIAGPSKAGLRVADELGPAHDAVDRQIEACGSCALHRRHGHDDRENGRGRRQASPGNVHEILKKWAVIIQLARTYHPCRPSTDQNYVYPSPLNDGEFRNALVFARPPPRNRNPRWSDPRPAGVGSGPNRTLVV